MGETRRPLIMSNCCSSMVKAQALSFFSPLQVSGAVTAGAEGAVHAARKVVDDFGDN